MRNAFRLFLFGLVVLGLFGSRAFGAQTKEEPQVTEESLQPEQHWVLLELTAWKTPGDMLATSQIEPQRFVVLLDPMPLKRTWWNEGLDRVELGERYRCKATVGDYRYKIHFDWIIGRNALSFWGMAETIDPAPYEHLPALAATLSYRTGESDGVNIFAVPYQISVYISGDKAHLDEFVAYRTVELGAKSLTCAIEQMRSDSH